jgi:hypothetical protein
MSRAGRRPLGLFHLLVAASVLATVAGISTPASAQPVTQSLVVSDDPVDYTPHALTGRVYGIVVIGDTVVVGGGFKGVTEADGTPVDRDYLFAFDKDTGEISNTFVPDLDGRVLSLATDGTYVYAGGEFTHTNGDTTRRLVKLDLDGDVVTAFDGRVTLGASVKDVALANGLVYIAGEFTKVNTVERLGLAAVDDVTGDLVDGVDIPFEGLHNGGVSHVARIEVSPDGTKMVAIGNFKTVDGLAREQIAILNLTPTTATVSTWATTRFVGQCAAKFDTYLRDIDISPDGSYFVVVTTGAFFGGSGSGVTCDTASRWPLNATGANQQPTWLDYSGGDTFWRVAISGTAIYVGGHFRWMNNPFAGDAKGPGALTRHGIAALDPINGLPFSWNPGRDIGEGVFDFTLTSEGLYVGHDTDTIGGEYHNRLAFFPLDGGTSVYVHAQATLPNTLYTMPATGETSMAQRSFDGSVAGARSLVSTPAVDWSNARGAFYADGKIYYCTTGGEMFRRTWGGGSSPGKAKKVFPRGLTASYFPMASLTGMFLENGRLYYTVSGDDRLYYRYFTVESNVIGSVTFTAVLPGSGFTWGTVRGMTLAGGTLYVARTDGKLYSIGWSNGLPVTGSQAVVDSQTSQQWSTFGMFVRNV